MDRSSPQTPKNLEDQLRNMILGNVTISDGDKTNDRPFGQAPQQQNRRTFPRGPTWHKQNQSKQMQVTHAVTPENQTGAPPETINRNRQLQSKEPAHPPTPEMNGVNSSPNEATPANNPRSGRRYPPRQQRQPLPQGQQSGARHGPSNNGSPAMLHNPKSLQRPQHHSGPPLNHTAASPMVQNSSRQAGYPTHPRQMNHVTENPMAQIEYLDRLASQEVPKVEIAMTELEEKEAFRKQLEGIFKAAIEQGNTGDLVTIDLVGFGSLSSGFATPGSDMDLAIVPTWKDTADHHNFDTGPDIPRLLEKTVLECKMGARLLTRTRVPILKVCQQPSEELYNALFDERAKWDELPEEEKYPPPPPPPPPPEATSNSKALVEIDGQKPAEVTRHDDANKGFDANTVSWPDVRASKEKEPASPKSPASKQSDSAASVPSSAQSAEPQEANNHAKEEKHHERPWKREKVLGPLDFPKFGIGIQCDINFENPLAIHNTHLLRCYALCDPRVRPMVLFVKSWAKRRKINSSYSGTLSSYGWVLMVLHYLVNVAQPPVCPNLQLCWRPPTDLEGLEKMFKETIIAGYAVRFWRNEQEILHAGRSGQLTRNTQSVGALLRGFFQYFAGTSSGWGYGPRPRQFYWTNEVLSLRTLGGIRPKAEKGWTGAKTIVMAGKEIRHRYLFAIEDPFELDHNVARTVTHNGIVAIRDEFRRAWGILSAVGRNQQPEGLIFDDVVEKPPPPQLEVDGEKSVVRDNSKIDGEADAQNATEEAGNVQAKINEAVGAAAAAQANTL